MNGRTFCFLCIILAGSVAFVDLYLHDRGRFWWACGLDGLIVLFLLGRNLIVRRPK